MPCSDVAKLLWLTTWPLHGRDKERTRDRERNREKERNIDRQTDRDRERLALFLQHLVGVQDLGLVGKPEGPAVDELQNLLLHRLWRPRTQVLGRPRGSRVKYGAVKE